MSVLAKEQQKLQNSTGILLSRVLHTEYEPLLKTKLSTYKSQEFIPFVHERDGIGRLIQPKKPNKFEVTNSIPIITSKSEESDDDLQQNLNTQQKQPSTLNYDTFKKKNFQQHAREASKLSRKQFLSQQLKKTFPQSIPEIVPILPPLLKISKEYHNVQLENKFKKIPSCKIRKQSHPNMSTLKTGEKLKECTHLQKIRSKSLSSLPKKIQVEEPKVDILDLLIPKKQIKLSYDHPEFDKMKQIKRLSMKVINTFEETHNKFIQNYKESRKIAARLRNQFEVY